MKNETGGIALIIAKAAVVAIISVFFASVILGVLVSKEYLQLSQGRIVLLGLFSITTFAASLYCAKKAKKRKLVISLVAGLVIIIAMMFLRLVSGVESLGTEVGKYGIVFVVCIIAGALSCQKKTRKR